MIVQISSSEWRILENGKFLPRTFTSRLNVHAYAHRNERTGCSQGHPLIGSNVVWSRGYRRCRECDNAYSREYQAANREKLNAGQRTRYWERVGQKNADAIFGKRNAK